jgi:hypothetical protein
LQEEIEAMGKRRQGLEEGRMDLPRPVEAAFRHLESRYPGAPPRVLCNLAQPREGSRWQNALLWAGIASLRPRLTSSLRGRKRKAPKSSSLRGA